MKDPQSGRILEVQNGRYLRFSMRDDRLRIFITDEGREELRSLRTDKDDEGRWRYEQNDMLTFWHLAEHFWTNGWIEVRPEQVGDLRGEDWLVMSQDFAYASENNDDKLVVGVAYSFTNYWRDSYLQDLLMQGYVDWQKHEYLTPDEFEEAYALTERGKLDAQELFGAVQMQGA